MSESLAEELPSRGHPWGALRKARGAEYKESGHRKSQRDQHRIKLVCFMVYPESAPTASPRETITRVPVCCRASKNENASGPDDTAKTDALTGSAMCWKRSSIVSPSLRACSSACACDDLLQKQGDLLRALDRSQMPRAGNHCERRAGNHVAEALRHGDGVA